MLLDKENSIEKIDLGLPTSSAAESLTKLVISVLRQQDIIAKSIPARLLVRNWPPAFTEWSTKAVRDVFYASPKFPRLINGESIKETIARGASEGQIAYAGKNAKGEYIPFYFKENTDAQDVEISEDMFIITGEEAEKRTEPPHITKILVYPSEIQLRPGKKQTFRAEGFDQFGREISIEMLQWSATGGTIDREGTFLSGKDEGNFIASAESLGTKGSANVTISKTDEGKPTPPQWPKVAGKITWSGEIPSQNWTNFYMKVLTKLVSSGDVKLTVSVEAVLKGEATDQQVEEIKAALRGLGLDDDIRPE